MTASLRHLVPAVGVLMLLAGSPTPTRAAIDQQNLVNQTFTVTFLPALGQSFTPTLNSIDFATFSLSNTNPSTYKVQVYTGVGFGGTLLGESVAKPVALAPPTPPGQPITVDNAQPVQFDFATPIGLTPGNVYTLRVAQVTGSGGAFFLRTGLNDPYPGGQAYDVAAQPTLDYYFIEGVRIPEPSSAALVGLAMFASLRHGRRRALATDR